LLHCHLRVTAACLMLVAVLSQSLPADAANHVRRGRAPRVVVNAPSTVAGTVAVDVAATGKHIVSVELYLNGVLVASYSEPSATFNWDSTTVANGVHRFRATATDASGRVGRSARARVTVANAAVEPPPGSGTPPEPPPSPTTTYSVTWLAPNTGAEQSGTAISGPGPVTLTPPFGGDAVVLLRRQGLPSPPSVSGTPLLRVHPTNGRYFADNNGVAIYLTGSHVWNNLLNYGAGHPLSGFDFTTYLNFLQANGHNFIRLWGADDPIGLKALPYIYAWMGSQVDLDQYDQGYFDMLRDRIIAAGSLGIYVGIMLFSDQSAQKSEDWPRHFFNPANNIQGISGDTDGDGLGREMYDSDLNSPSTISARQEAYVRKVIDTVNDLDNILYEVANEGHPNSLAWQINMVNFIHSYEAGKPKQHPVGMTAFWAPDYDPTGPNANLYASPAEWTNPFGPAYADNHPDAPTSKVTLLDTDHIFGVGGDATWVWKAFMRGYNPIYMDPIAFGAPNDIWPALASQTAEILSARRAMGQTREFSRRVTLASMTPQGGLASSGYCLANVGQEYLVYQPGGGPVTVTLP
jgi:hypothetical protein